jgi:hypothetical protein
VSETDRSLLSADEAYELLAFLITSAENQLVEPAFYGPRRLVDAAAQLVAAISPHVPEPDRTWLAYFLDEANQKAGWARRNPAGFKSFLEESSAGVARELKRRAGLDAPTREDA